MDAIQLLTKYGLSTQEAKLYASLITCGASTGYELAKHSGVSRSNAYAGLSGLQDKGAALLADGKPAIYHAVPVGEFCANVLRELEEGKHWLEQALPVFREEDSGGYLTIKGEENICHKISTLVISTKTHIYLSMNTALLQRFEPELKQILQREKKVVLLTNAAISLPGAVFHINPQQGNSIRIICDTAHALTGNLSGDPGCSCLYSQKQHLVALLRDSMKNEIRLIELEGGK